MDLEKQDLAMLFSKIKHLLDTFESNIFDKPQTSDKPKVSICLITYNHGNYLPITLDNILSQKTNFDYELIISDDNSSDDSKNIIKEYALKYPTKIRAYLHPYNLSKKFPEYTPGKLNFLFGLSRCKGEYIVHVEGDDYFCNDEKLQKQADFLDKNTYFSACFHNALMKFEDKSGREDYNINPPNQKERIVPEDFLKEKETWFMATAAVMFRKSFVEKLPHWFAFSKSGDIPLYVILSDQAPIGYLPEVMSVYRRHLEGMSYTDSNFDANFVNNRIFMYENINNFTKNKYKSLIYSILASYYKMLPDCTQNINHNWKRMKPLLISLKYEQPHGIYGWKVFIKSLFTTETYLKISALKRKLFGIFS